MPPVGQKRTSASVLDRFARAVTVWTLLHEAHKAPLLRYPPPTLAVRTYVRFAVFRAAVFACLARFFDRKIYFFFGAEHRFVKFDPKSYL